MPSLALATGAGAGQGLEDLLLRLVRERELGQRDRQMGEVERSNKEGERLRGEEIASTQGYRDATLAATRATQQAAATDRQDRQVQQAASIRPIGAPVGVEEFGREQTSGIPMGNYTFGPRELPMLTPKPKMGDGPTEWDSRATEAAINSNPFATWKGTQPQIQAAENGAKTTEGADQIRKYTIPGRGVVEAFVDPRSHAMVLRDGSPLPQNAVPYEAPPSMTTIQTQGGFMQVPSRGGTARPVEDNAGNQVQPPVTGSTRTMTEGAKKLLNLPDRVEALADVMGDEQFGIVASRLRSLLLKVGSVEEFEAGMPGVTAGMDRTAARFATELGLLASGVGRVHGGARGGGSIQMISYMRNLLGDVGTRDVLKGRMDAARDILGLYANGEFPTDTLLDNPGQTPPADPGAIPQVGGTFQGGKVLRVTPITR